MLFVKKKEVDPKIKEINDMIDFLIYDGTQVNLGHEGRLIRNGVLHLLRNEEYAARHVDFGDVVHDYIDYLTGKAKRDGYANVFGNGGACGHSVRRRIKYQEPYQGYKDVYDVEVNLETDEEYISLISKMDVEDIDFDSEWYNVLCEEYQKEKTNRGKVLQKRR